MKRPAESDYNSHVAYTRALEEYCDRLELAQEPVACVHIKDGCLVGSHKKDGLFPDGQYGLCKSNNV